jgi:acetoin utilization deacetylase AcuC-like enzyme
MVNSRELDNAFALVRPPGHHAEKARAMGFCIFNNVAVGAKFAQEDLNLDRILIVDWDLHHGNGTQHSFENDSSILYFSSHQFPYYPGSGNFDEIGINQGIGYTVNVPLSMGYGDEEFIAIYEKVLRPIAIEYNPDMILVSAGFDIHFDDPLGGMRVTPNGFAGITRSIMEIASECCDGKLVITLEGGYDLDGLSNSVKQVLRELSGISHTDINGLMKNADLDKVNYAINPVLQTHHQYWNSLST